MSEHSEEPVLAKSLVKGMIAGLIGGLVATAAKTVAEKIYPPRTEGQPEPPEVLAERISGELGHHLSGGEKAVASEVIHWGFGALTGAAYGALAEYFPAATAKEGASFGLALATLTHETALSAMGLTAEPEEQTTREHTSEMATHVVYGLMTETVRRFVRKRLG
ncbi:MAG: putative periplasmic/secreted protein [Acidobacteriaceae bacterium]|nr:putative periplasmic/secreted protein [Acidobacteriaceae bacterium]